MPRFLILAALLVLASTAHAAEEPQYNRVDFSTEAAREVGNDLLQAQMRLEVSDPSPAKVAQLLNTTVNAALKKGAAFPAVKVASGNYTTYPIYGKNNRLDGWRGNAQIRLESRDFKAAGELIGELQGSMQLAGVSFTVAPETRKKLEDELVGEGLAAFRQRAEAIRAALGGSGYKIVHVGINSGGYHPPQPLLDGVVAMRAMAAPAPEFSGGESDLTMQVSGTIEIIFPPAAQ
jgi:predicted secreted protein